MGRQRVNRPGRHAFALLALGLSLLVGLLVPIGDVSVANALGEPADSPALPLATDSEESSPAEANPSGSETAEDNTDPAAAEEAPAQPQPALPADAVSGSTEPEAAAQAQVPNGLIAFPTNNEPVGSGPAPVVTSTMTPENYTLSSGKTRTYTVTYENQGSTSVTNARLWHQVMNRGNHNSVFTVSCVSQVHAGTGGSCPAWTPAGTQSIPSGQDHEYYLTFAGVATFQPYQKLTFTVAVTVSVAQDSCTETGAAMSGGWARYSSTGFDVTEIEGSASSVGAVSGWAICPPGDITMGNTVTAPRPPSADPSRVLSGDTRTFEVSWENQSTSTSHSGVPISYTYYVPYVGQTTLAVWSCSANGSTTTCPAFLTGSRTVTHDNPGEDPDLVFEGKADFPPGKKYTVTLTLATTINSCTQDGYLRVQGYANRSAIGAEAQGRTKSSELVEIGCSTWMLTESFAGTSVPDRGWTGLNDACLTSAPKGSVATNGLGYCDKRQNSPKTNFQSPVGTPKGYLQLTDDRDNRVGAALYNRGLPAKDGLVVEFTSYQYGNDRRGADGIGFFLSDGSYDLDKPGDSGGALGYAYRPSNTANLYNKNGLAHGYLGLGLDVYGNYVNTGHVATNCANTNPLERPQSVGLRGPGNLRSGYCLLAHSQVSKNSPAQQLDYADAKIPDSANANYDSSLRDALDKAKRRTRVTLYPVKANETKPRVTVEIDFNEGFYRTVIDHIMPESAPPLIKFGFLAATGGSKQAHLIDSVRVGTVLPMKDLSLTKVIDYDGSSAIDAGKSAFDVGDTVKYKFLVVNSTPQQASGLTDIYNIQLNDPLITALACPRQTLARQESMECTGSLQVSEAQRDAGRILNTATILGATSSAASAPQNLSDKSTAEAAINPEAINDLRVIAPGGAATFQILKSGSALGIVKPDDPSRLTLEVWNGGAWLPAPTTGATQVPAANGNWTVDTSNKVTFLHANGQGQAVAPLKYRVKNVFGGWSEALLQVTVSTTPYSVCLPEQSQLSGQNWGFGINALLSFGENRASVPSAGTYANLTSDHGSFTVSDSSGKLLFVVDSGSGSSKAVIRNSSGAVMAGSSVLGEALVGASPITVFPAGQGTGKFVVVTSSATQKAAGQLSYRLVDMTQNAGSGLVGAPTSLGSAGASMAVLSIPNADGTGYWVVNPKKVGRDIQAYQFRGQEPTNRNSPVVSTVGSPTVDSGTPTSYEDIRMSHDMSRIATLASTDSALLASGRTRIKLLTFDATNGELSPAGSGFERTLGESNQLGYSLEFTPSGGRLYASSLATSGANYSLKYASISENWLSTLGTFLSASRLQRYGGAVRAGADGRLYWASGGDAAQTSVRFIAEPDTSTSLSSLALAKDAKSTIGLTNVLADCAIPAANFNLEKYASDGRTLMAGATFALFRDTNGAPDASAVTPGIQAVGGQNGKFIATGIAPGAYWLRETKALSGHQLLAQDVLVNVALGGAVSIDAANNPQVKLLTRDSGNSRSYTIQVTNVKSPTLPLTGGQWLHAVTFGGGALLVVAVVASIWWRRRRGISDFPDHDSCN